MNDPTTNLAELAQSARSFVKVDKATILTATEGVEHPAATLLRAGADEGSGTYPWFAVSPAVIAEALPHLKLAAPTAEPTAPAVEAAAPPTVPPVAPPVAPQPTADAASQRVRQRPVVAAEPSAETPS